MKGRERWWGATHSVVLLEKEQPIAPPRFMRCQSLTTTSKLSRAVRPILNCQGMKFTKENPHCNMDTKRRGRDRTRTDEVLETEDNRDLRFTKITRLRRTVYQNSSTVTLPSHFQRANFSWLVSFPLIWSTRDLLLLFPPQLLGRIGESETIIG